MVKHGERVHYGEVRERVHYDEARREGTLW